MRILQAVVVTALFGLTSVQIAHAQEEEAATDEAAAEELSIEGGVAADEPVDEWLSKPPDGHPIQSSRGPIFRSTPGVEEASLNWWQALQDTPRLVSLQVTEKPGATAKDRLESRLKVLGSKTFSNREWRAYWENQAKTAGALFRALKADRGVPTSDGELRVWGALDEWAGLANDKVANQDRYFKAIEAERDAIEERVESFLDAPTMSPVTTTALDDMPNPYEKRRLHLQDLERQIEWQKAKRQGAESVIKFIERQLEVEKTLNEALVNDVALAEREHVIALDQRAVIADQGETSLAGWAAVWGPIAEYAGVKVSKLLAESQLGAARQREREVEVGLAQSQLNFRNERLTGLEGQLKEDGQFAGWLEATGETLLAWLTGQSWRIAIGLLLIWVGLQFALRLVGRVSGVIMEHAEGEPDNADDVDQRSKTLATVFEGMARIALYIVAALLALEQIGVNTAPILGSVAILGLAVSFGSQNLVRDVVNGFFILLENQYAVGEFVNIGGKSGTVEKITIRSTWIKAATGDLHVIPNGSVTSVTNSQRTWARSICEIGVAYDADLAKVKEVIDRVGQEMAAEEEWFSKFYEEDGETDVPAWVGVTALGDSAVTVRAWVKVDAGQQWGVERELNRRFKLAFDAAGIEIPFPQRVVHNKSA